MGYGPYKRVARPGSYPPPDGMPIALEYDGNDHAALVGLIIATFAAMERELPVMISRVTGMSQQDAVLTCSVFRSFNSRLDILEKLLSSRNVTSHDRIVYGHCKGLLKEANGLRNKYAHSLFAKGHKMQLSPFHHDYKGPEAWEDAELPKLTRDRKRMAVILGELFAILYQKQLPPGIYDKLLPKDR